MTDPKVLIFNSISQLVENFSLFFKDLINQTEGDFCVALSGGSTPKVWFEELVKNHKKDIPWEKVHFYWGDERCVLPEDEESNFGMTKKYLLDHVQIPVQNIHRIHGELAPEQAAKNYENELVQNLTMDRFPIFDLVILGMGDDGHTASIFPHQIALWNSSKSCVIASHPVSGQHRVSISGGVINNACAVAFLVTGKNKAEKVSEIIHKKPIAVNYPASLVAPKKGLLRWFLDSSSAQKL